MAKPPGAVYYVPDDVHGFTRRAIKGSGDPVAVDGVAKPVPKDSLQVVSAVAPDGPADMIELDVLNEGAMLECLQTRFKRDDIYTNVGPILVALNPFKDIPSLYDAAAAERHRSRSVGSAQPTGTEMQREPHIFGLADLAYRQMRTLGENQAVLISGESGAGKTETTKLVLRYLTKRAANDAADATNARIQQQILDANPVLEALGNAKTLRNNNSSRFGKWFEVQIQQDTGGIVGGTLTSYLLEKSRVVAQGPGERNYHIFYQLCAGAAETERNEKLGLKSPESFRFLRGCTAIDGVDDRADFAIVDEALEVVGVSRVDIEGAYRLLAALLHLGNVTFDAADESNATSGCEPSAACAGSLARAARLLGVEQAALTKALTLRTMTTGRGKSVYQLSLGVDGAEQSRDALAKECYSRLFAFVVTTIDNVMRDGDGKRRGAAMEEGIRKIGVLDIFGFENFDTNSFEQLCINYTNERLQCHFVHHFFHFEQLEYEKEGLAWTNVAFTDNQPCLNLLEKKLGVFDLLQEACRMPNASDDSLAVKMIETLKSNKHFDAAKYNPKAFVVHHFAGSVEYSSAGFCEKNKDQLFDDLAVALLASKDTFVKDRIAAAGGLSRGSAVAGATVSSQFLKQITSLMETLGKCSPSYVRCIKTSAVKAPDVFEGCMVLRQLRYSGILDTVRIRKEGYAIRMKYEDVMDRFNSFRDGFRAVNGDNTIQARCARLMQHLGIPEGSKGYAAGKTKVFFKDTSTFAILLSKLEAIQGEFATRIQCAVRRRQAAKRVADLKTQRMHRWATTVQALWRMKRARNLRNALRDEASALAAQAREESRIKEEAAAAARQAAEEEEARAAAAEKERAAEKARQRAARLAKRQRDVGRTGWLSKRGGAKSSGFLGRLKAIWWKDRFFKLSSRGLLAYYTAEEENAALFGGFMVTSTIKGSYEMRHCLSVEPVDLGDSRPHGLLVKLDPRACDGAEEVALSASSAQERDLWVSAIRAWSDYLGRWNEPVAGSDDDDGGGGGGG